MPGPLQTAPVNPGTCRRDTLNLGISVARCRADAPPQPPLFGFSPPSTVNPKLELGPVTVIFDRQSHFPFFCSSSGPDRTLNNFSFFLFILETQINERAQSFSSQFLFVVDFIFLIFSAKLPIAARHFRLSHLHS